MSRMLPEFDDPRAPFGLAAFDILSREEPEEDDEEDEDDDDEEAEDNGQAEGYSE